MTSTEEQHPFPDNGLEEGKEDELSRNESKTLEKDRCAVNKEIAELKEKLSVEKERQREYYDKYIRLQAEFDNFKKRIEREKCEFYRYALERLIKDVLPVIDNFELAIRSAEQSKDFNGLCEGVRLIYKQLQDILEKEGLTYECSVGEDFDPCKHEAVLHLESNEHKKNVVIEEHKKGYFLNDRLIRPAIVTVAKEPERKPERKKE